MKFSVITVCLNAGEKLSHTIDSVLSQTFSDYEIIIKDGGSKDGSTKSLREEERIRLITSKDKSIYDAMNQAISHARGEYLLFLNCGDLLAKEDVLENVANAISKSQADIVYGDLLKAGNATVIASPEEITDFVCYRNIPCHQVCFYKKHLFEKRGYDLRYPVRADYEHFLWCKYAGGATFYHAPYPVCIYEGDGFSETKENLKKATREHREITKKYIGKKCILYRGIMIVTLQPLRKAMASSKRFAGIYEKAKRIFYRAGNRKKG